MQLINVICFYILNIYPPILTDFITTIVSEKHSLPETNKRIIRFVKKKKPPPKTKKQKQKNIKLSIPKQEREKITIVE